MIAPAGDWGGGYVTDIPYLPGYYRHQSPLHLNAACLIAGVSGIGVEPGTRLRYLELGCGHGVGALMLAGCNPAWEVVGIDFNPAHIAAARRLAADAEIANVRFIEADLARLAETPAGQGLPEFDVVTMHGLWSWVEEPVRAGIVRLLADKLRPGGIAYLSYNALPAWQSALGMQRLLLEAGRRAGGRSDRQVAAGWDLVRSLAEAKAPHLSDSQLVGSLGEYSRQAQPAYLAHEYMNAAWHPCFHADVVRFLAAAKLEWVGSAQLLENFSSLMLGDEARTAAARFDDPVMRELIKDMFLTRCLRQDIFVRGARRLALDERDAGLCDLMLGLAVREADFAWEFDVPVGSATFGTEFFGPIVRALADGPRRVADLLALPGLPRRDNPSEVVGMLVGSHQALPVLGAATAPKEPIRKLIAALVRFFVRPDALDLGMALPASGTGSPVPCTMLDLFIADRLQRDDAPADPALWAAELGPGEPANEQQRLCRFIERILAERAPIWRQLGALPRVLAS
jgi:SAM-dependent methyltransferase